MKTTTNILTLAILAAVLVLAFGSTRPQTAVSAQSQIPSDSACCKDRSVQVSGAAVINVVPDRVLLQVGVETNGLTPEAVQDANAREIQDVISAVRALGVESKDIATDYLIVYPLYSDYDSLQIKGYRTNNIVSVTLRDITLVDDAVVAALKAGANEIQDIQFYTSELRKYRDQGRELAMKAASEKAQALAAAAGAQAGCVLTISENTWTQYYGSWRGGRETTLWAQNVVQNAAPTQGQTAALDDSPISLGQIAVRAEVNASFSLK